MPDENFETSSHPAESIFVFFKIKNSPSFVIVREGASLLLTLDCPKQGFSKICSPPLKFAWSDVDAWIGIWNGKIPPLVSVVAALSVVRFFFLFLTASPFCTFSIFTFHSQQYFFLSLLVGWFTVIICVLFYHNFLSPFLPERCQHTFWVDRGLGRRESSSRKCIWRQNFAFKLTVTLSLKDWLRWIFALMVVVDKPLAATVSAAMRILLKNCSEARMLRVRCSVSLFLQGFWPIFQNKEDDLATLNVLIVIAGDYFGQAGRDFVTDDGREDDDEEE